MERYKIADVVFDVLPIYEYTARLCQNYRYDGEALPEVTFIMCEQDVQNERAKSQDDYPNAYFEALALLRKLCVYVLESANGFILHGSAIMVDDKGYLFTAPSGTGKSTHVRLWREYLGEKVKMINDDKPIVRLVDGKFYIYGTPWSGKHRLDNNCRAPLKGICKISRAEQNSIDEVGAEVMLDEVLNQTLRPTQIDGMDKLLALAERLVGSVKCFHIKCNQSVDAAKLAFDAMTKGEGNA